ncbi:YaaC family protein [Falsibacillus pallidus]|uniref:YaaC-like protein n=1 Tax=Falsibacillus pallidus TaxID=493781 RepID=A0A370FYM5_9BACI|nr:YaaC family protein [Falsibacillus pallidus]RDI36642.1 YaaC-like protein [Falsibacillus pallidus]
MNEHTTRWDYLTNFQSSVHSQRFLSKCYEKAQLDQADAQSYNNSYSFIYYLEHGRLYVDQAEQSPIYIKPILLFYGLVNLIKACLLTVDPFYPATTGVLAHGLSSRKRKKRNYFFFQDEVKIQKNGLFSHFSHQMFHVKHLEGDKLVMGNLLKEIPELDEAFKFIRGAENFYRLAKSDEAYQLPSNLPGQFKMADSKFKEYLSSKNNGIQWLQDRELAFRFNTPSLVPFFAPFRYDIYTDTLCLSREQSEDDTLSELIIYYALLYNLSMIARYETEWWSELIKHTPNQDFPLITKFLSISQNKIPLLISDYLRCVEDAL